MNKLDRIRTAISRAIPTSRHDELLDVINEVAAILDEPDEPLYGDEWALEAAGLSTPEQDRWTYTERPCPLCDVVPVGGFTSHSHRTPPRSEPRTELREKVYGIMHDLQCDEKPQPHSWKEHLPWDDDYYETDAEELADALIDALAAHPTAASETATNLTIRRLIADLDECRATAASTDALRAARQKVADIASIVVDADVDDDAARVQSILERVNRYAHEAAGMILAATPPSAHPIPASWYAEPFIEGRRVPASVVVHPPAETMEPIIDAFVAVTHPATEGLDVERLAQAGGNVLDGRRIGSVRLFRNTITPDDWSAIAAEYARLSSPEGQK